jgi:hypothetical protein
MPETNAGNSVQGTGVATRHGTLGMFPFSDQARYVMAPIEIV